MHVNAIFSKCFYKEIKELRKISLLTTSSTLSVLTLQGPLPFPYFLIETKRNKTQRQISQIANCLYPSFYFN